MVSRHALKAIGGTVGKTAAEMASPTSESKGRVRGDASETSANVSMASTSRGRHVAEALDGEVASPSFIVTLALVMAASFILIAVFIVSGPSGLPKVPSLAS